MVSKPAALTGLVSGQNTERALESDEVLAARGDADSFIRLYKAHVAPVYRYLLGRLGDRQDAEDVTSAVFERAWHSLGRYRPGASTFKAWLFVIAQRTLVDHYRRHAPRANRMDALSELLPDHAPGPEEHALGAEQLKQLLAAVRRLGAEQQEVICLRFLAELQYAEIAKITRKRESAVKMTVYRALEELRRSYHDV